MCNKCNQTNECNCNNTVPCQKCNTPACNSVCRFTGENINGLGIIKNEDISTAIEKLAEYALNLLTASQSIVKLESRTNINVGTSGYPTITNSSTLLGTTFNVPLNAGSEHDVYYEGQVRFVNASEIVLGIYKNGSIQGFLKKIKSGANTVIPFSFSASDLMLVPGDIVDVRGVKINTSAELEYCTIKIVKR